MSSPKQLDVAPVETLEFFPPKAGDNDSTAILKLFNPGQEVIMFKIKTTAPRRYCVRPNSGRVEPNQGVSVSVMLQPPFPPKREEKEKPNKFLVQSAVLPDTTIPESGIQSLWKKMEKADKKSIFEQKLKCQWHFDDYTGGNSVDPEAALGVTFEAAAPAQSSRAAPEVASAQAKAAPTPTPAKAVAAAAAAGSLTAVAKKSQLPELVLLIIAFVIGMLMGKFVL